VLYLHSVGVSLSKCASIKNYPSMNFIWWLRWS